MDSFYFSSVSQRGSRRMTGAALVVAAWFAVVGVTHSFAGEVIVPNDSQWKWLHPTDGADPAISDADFHSTFYRAKYDDSAWKTGQDKPGPHGGFGYGEDDFDGVDIGKPPEGTDRKTAYFRCRFETTKGYKGQVTKVRVSKVKGVYYKVTPGSKDEGLKGRRATFRRASVPEKVVATGTITFVKDEYLIVKLPSDLGQVGDIVVVAGKVSSKPTDSTGPTKPPAVATALDGAVGKRINIAMTKDYYYRDVTLGELVRDRKTGKVKFISIEIGPSPYDLRIKKKKKAKMGLSLVHRVTSDDGKTLFESPKAKMESVERSKWMARLKVHGVKAWPHLTRAQHDAAVAKSRKTIAEVGKAYPRMRLYETNFFLFFSDIPANQIGPYIVSLDAMHNMMCKMYNIKMNTPIWQGKALVFAFLNKSDFLGYEERFKKYTPGENTYGLCHSDNSGEVTIACYRGDRPTTFAQMLVHETSHGFNRRFQTTVHLHSWINEGIAEMVGELMVPADRSVAHKERSGMQALKERAGHVGENFFASDRNIEGWQYGVTTKLAKFMRATNSRSYIAFLKGIKEGLKVDESLQKHFGASRQQLLTAYGRSIGMPQLRE